MGVIEEIKQALRIASDVPNKLDKVRRRSIARGANDQTFQFPCIISDSVPIDKAATLAKNLDRLYASWVQIYLSGIGIIDLNYVKNPRQFIQMYQTNFNLESAEDDEEEEFYSEYVKELRENMFRDPQLYVHEKTGNVLLIMESETCPVAIQKSCKDALRPHLDGYSTKGIPFTEANGELNDMINAYIDKQKEDELQKNAEDRLRASRETRAPQLADKDVKRLNDMQPYTLDLKLLATKGESGLAQYVNYTVGVKSVMHLGSSDNLIMNMVYVLKNRNPLFNFIKWTTGEISLFKDILFRLDEVNFNVANRNDKTGKMISTLKRLKNKPVHVGLGGLSKVVPFATICISTYEYNQIKDRFGFDLKNVTYVKKIMDELFLMCFIILDDTSATIDMMIDGSNTFQTYSLDTLEREVTMNSSKLGKELTRMLGGN